jgi:transcriptional regulator with XRE-family HTH domain
MSGSIAHSNFGHRPTHGDKLIHKLRDRRIAKGWSQQTLAVLIGVHSNEINRWEHKRTSPRSDTFVAWLEILDFKIVGPEESDYEI